MNRKMILALTAAIALAAWVSAKPGTWGKENPVNENEAKAPAAMLNQWLNEFTAAYEQRDGEAMDELLKQFEGAKSEFPAAPRFEKWMAGVQEAYKGQDIRKMGRLLDNAHQLRERMRERFGRNQGRRGPENATDFRPDRRAMRGFGDRSQERMAPRARQFEPQGFGRRGGIPEDRWYDGRHPQRFDAERPMQPQWGPRRSVPRQQPGYGPMPQRQQPRYGRPDFDRPMRDEFEQPYYDQQVPRRQMRHHQRYAPEDFWD